MNNDSSTLISWTPPTSPTVPLPAITVEVTTSCNVGYHFNFRHLFQTVIRDKRTCIAWCKENGLLPATKLCKYCQQPCRLTESDTCVGLFRCQRNGHVGGATFKTSIAKGTFFEGARITPETVLILVYCYAVGYSHSCALHETALDSKTTSQETVSDWYCNMQEINESYLLTQPSGDKIGGPGKCVKIVENRLPQRQFKIGRRFGGALCLAMMGEDGSQFRVEVCPDDEQGVNARLALIEKYVEAGTMIHSNCLEEYEENLITMGYCYKKFKNPIRYWGTKGARNSRHRHSLLVFLWRRQMRLEGKDPFVGLVSIIRDAFA